jgi:hypothetical protein
MSELYLMSRLPEVTPVAPAPVDHLVDKVVMLVGQGGEGERALAVSLAERGADIALVCPRGALPQARETRKLVEQAGRRCQVIPARTSELSDSAAAGQAILASAQVLGAPEIFIILGL